MWRSEDEGLSWTEVDFGEEDAPIVDIELHYQHDGSVRATHASKETQPRRAPASLLGFRCRMGWPPGQAFFVSSGLRHYRTTDYGKTTRLFTTPVQPDPSLPHFFMPHPDELEWLLAIGRPKTCSDSQPCSTKAYASTDGGLHWNDLGGPYASCMWARRHGITSVHKSTIVCQGAAGIGPAAPRGAVVVWKEWKKETTAIASTYDLVGGDDFMVLTVPRESNSTTPPAGVVQVDVLVWGYKDTFFRPARFPVSSVVVPYAVKLVPPAQGAIFMATRAYRNYLDRATLYTSTSEGENYIFEPVLRNVYRTTYVRAVPSPPGGRPGWR